MICSCHCSTITQVGVPCTQKWVSSPPLGSSASRFCTKMSVHKPFSRPQPVSQSSAHTVPTFSPWSLGTPGLAPPRAAQAPTKPGSLAFQPRLVPPKKGGLWHSWTNSHKKCSGQPSRPSMDVEQLLSPTSAVRDFPITLLTHYPPEPGLQGSPEQGPTLTPSSFAPALKGLRVPLLRGACPQEYHHLSAHRLPLHGVRKGGSGIK